MSRIVVVATSPVDRSALADHVEPTDELVVVEITAWRAQKIILKSIPGKTSTGSTR